MKASLKLLVALPAVLTMISGAFAQNPSKNLGPIQPFDPPVDQNGDPITSLDAPVYNSFCASAPNPILTADGQPILLGAWENVRGTATMECVGGGTQVNLHLTGLIPGGVYSAWVILANADRSDLLADGALGTPDGAQNHFVASAGGEGSLSVLHPAGPLSNLGGGYVVGSCLLTQPNVGEAIVGLAYHLDGETHGGHPYPGDADDGCSFALPIAFTTYTPDAPTALLALSARAAVGTNDNVVINGFNVAGEGASKRMLIRAIGPSLTPYHVAGVLQDPVLTVYDANGTPLETNDDWGSSGSAAAITASGKAPGDSHESAILRNFVPGLYTAIVRGANGTSGIALLEVYDLDASSTTAAGN